MANDGAAWDGQRVRTADGRAGVVLAHRGTLLRADHDGAHGTSWVPSSDCSREGGPVSPPATTAPAVDKDEPQLPLRDGGESVDDESMVGDSAERSRGASSKGPPTTANFKKVRQLGSGAFGTATLYQRIEVGSHPHPHPLSPLPTPLSTSTPKLFLLCPLLCPLPHGQAHAALASGTVPALITGHAVLGHKIQPPSQSLVIRVRCEFVTALRDCSSPRAL
jgi:hypothetical protein